MIRASLVDEIAAVRMICRDLGLGEVVPTVLKAAHHTTLRLAPLCLVARVQSAEPRDLAASRAAREISVARHLAGRGAPVVGPLADRLAGPHVAAGSIVTLWPDVGPARTAEEADAALAATTLAAVHCGLHDYAGDLPLFTQTLDRCWDELAHGGGALTADDRSLLEAQYRRLRHDIETSAGPWIPLHGDAHLGNMLLGADGPRWIDFEDACRGPREHDVACLPSAVWPCFGDADRALIERCADLKSVCVAIWCAADIGRSAEVREAAEYHLQRVRALAS